MSIARAYESSASQKCCSSLFRQFRLPSSQRSTTSAVVDGLCVNHHIQDVKRLPPATTVAPIAVRRVGLHVERFRIGTGESDCTCGGGPQIGARCDRWVFSLEASGAVTDSPP